MRAIVTGSKHWVDVDKMRDELAKLPVCTTVVVGNLQGAERMAARLAEEELGMDVEKWSDIDETSSFELLHRNKEMVASDIDVCVAFMLSNNEPEWDCVRRSRAAKINTIVVS